MIRIFLSALLVFSLSGWSLDGFYLGAQVGQVGLTGSSQITNDNTIGVGIDLGFRTSPLLDLTLQSQMSTHSGPGQNLKWYSQTLGVNFHLEVPDFDLSFGMGPGFYTFKTVNSSTFFGIHWDAAADVLLSDNLRTGLSFRYHSLFGEQGADDVWSVMMRFGYLFSMG